MWMRRAVSSGDALNPEAGGVRLFSGVCGELGAEQVLDKSFAIVCIDEPPGGVIQFNERDAHLADRCRHHRDPVWAFTGEPL